MESEDHVDYPNPSKLIPTTESERIVLLDVLRGFALLGILLMNIQSFSMTGAAYFNPTSFGSLKGGDYWSWLLSHLLADQKFMTIFSMLFGAGVILMWQRAEHAGRRSGGLHYRRMIWVCVFGLAHAYLLWYGDVLFIYGVCGMLVYWFRRRTVRTLLILGLLSLAVSSGLYLMAGLSMQYWPPEAREGFASGIWSPPASKIDEEIAAYRGGWSAQMKVRVPAALSMHTQAFFFWALWRAGGLMLIGMGMYKLGIFSGHRSLRFYWVLVGAGILVGLPLVAYGVHRNFAEDWQPARFFLGSQYNYWGSLLISLAWIGLVVIAYRQGWFSHLMQRFAAVGRLAFSNYLLHTLICTTIFYGHGLGLFGDVSRTVQLLIVAGIWILQLGISPVWLRHFRYGPFEWIWRSLTYWERLSFSRRTGTRNP